MPLSKDSKVFVAGHRGMVGSAICRSLEKDGYSNVITKTRNELDLLRQQDVDAFFSSEGIDAVVLAAARVGGIHANNEYPAEFIYQNLMIECNVIDAAYRNGVGNLLLLGSSCIYPKYASQPMTEDQLLTGVLEPTNEPYAVAKIAGIKLCESYNRQYKTDYRSVMPTNLFGPGDNFHPENSHVIPALIQRFHHAKLTNESFVSIWGTGKARREFLHVDDMASACLHVLNLEKSKYDENTEAMLSHINIGTGKDISIGELAVLIADVVGYSGELKFDTSKPDGTPRKLLDVTRLSNMGWNAEITLRDGLATTYEWYVNNYATARAS